MSLCFLKFLKIFVFIRQMNGGGGGRVVWRCLGIIIKSDKGRIIHKNN